MPLKIGECVLDSFIDTIKKGLSTKGVCRIDDTKTLGKCGAGQAASEKH